MVLVSPDKWVLYSEKKRSAATNAMPNAMMMPKFYSNISHYEDKINYHITYPPEMTVGVVERDRDKSVAIYGALSGDRANSPANLVRERYVFISRTARYKVRTCSVKCVKLVGYESLEAVPDRLTRNEHGKKHLLGDRSR